MNQRRTSAQLKQIARSRLSGKFGILIAAYLLYILIFGGMSMITAIVPPVSPVNIAINWGISFIISVFLSLFQAGLTYMMLNVCRFKVPQIGELLTAFKSHPDRFIVIAVIMQSINTVCQLPGMLLNLRQIQSETLSEIFIVLYGSSALVLLGSLIAIFITLPWALSYYLLLDNPELSAMDALKTSARLMKGNKGRYVYIYFSFFGWMLLSILSCYIGLLWIMPYMNVTLALFYMELTGELDHQERQIYEQQQYYNSFGNNGPWNGGY